MSEKYERIREIYNENSTIIYLVKEIASGEKYIHQTLS